MRIIVTGREGQVARALRALADETVEIVALARPELDLADPGSIEPALAAARPDVIVNAAAYTAVDKAEADEASACAVNAIGAGAIADAAASLGVPVVHISTDYVFDGRLGRPYREEDPVAPLGVYGRSKAAGEIAVGAAGANHATLRTAWVYSPHGANFLRTMLRLAGEREVVRVVADQRGAPTAAADVATGALAVARRLAGDPASNLRGVFHMTAAGEASWADFAEAIFAESAARGGPSARVERIGTRDYPTPAPRPADSRLDCTRLAARHGVRLPHWRARVGETVAAHLAEARTPELGRGDA
ncbi:dTDP-4-dehydrorhamnose reductase [Aurantimonas sp. C2-6-R+9]|uniref:dTDP-4-dehydrorhamnose reductase n=1 Tax=unclassified Aurantimonas TaxID=2638230 RepID=UPI002E16EE05|nr:dTDP-4-dehydrorhamnose reductase [Aurantimonas sp. C2-6-R+9]